MMDADRERAFDAYYAGGATPENTFRLFTAFVNSVHAKHMRCTSNTTTSGVRAKHAFGLMASRSEREMHARTLQELLYHAVRQLDGLCEYYDALSRDQGEGSAEIAQECLGDFCRTCRIICESVRGDETYEQYERERVESEECHRRWELAAARDGRESVHGGVLAQSAAGPG